jgi:hypothetical protein
MLSFFEKNKTVKPKKNFDAPKKFQDLKKIPSSELKQRLVDSKLMLLLHIKSIINYILPS